MYRNFFIVVVVVLLFLIPKYSFAANYYFHASVDNDWANVLNWWQDIGFMTQALAIPSTSDDVIMYSSVNDISAGVASVNTATFYNNVAWSYGSETKTLTVSNGAVFNNTSSNIGNIDGNAIFNNSSYNFGTIGNNAIFNGNFSESGVDGFVSGVKTRYYTSDIAIKRDFVSDGPWTVVADGAVVNTINSIIDSDPVSSTYTTLSTLNGGSFENTAYDPFPPYSPVFNTKSNIATAGNAFGNAISADGNTAYVVGYDCNCLYIHDVTDKSNPTLLYSTTTDVDYTEFVVSNGNNYVYVFTYGEEIIVYNVTDPSNPIRVTTVITPGLSSRKAHIMDDGYLYVVDGDAGDLYIAMIFDISNPALPTLITSLPGGVTNDGADILKIGNYLYIGDNGDGQTTEAHITIYDVTNVASPVLIRTITVGHSDYQGQYGFIPWRLLTKDNALYILDDKLLDVYDISSSTNPIYSNEIVIYKDVEGAELKDNFLYFAGSQKEGEPGKIVAFDISNALSPRAVAEIDTGAPNSWISIDNLGYVYILTLNGQLNIFDPIDKPALVTNSITNPNVTSVTLNAIITSENSASTTDRGFNYGPTSSYGSIASTTVPIGIGSFSESLSGLVCATTYHYRAFATNYVGTATTSDATFTTDSCPTLPTPTPSGGSSSSSGSRISPQVIATIFGTSTPATSVSPGISYTALFTRSLTTGSSGNDVKNLQQYLNAKGFTVSLTGPGSQGNETNYFGALTRQALARFQKAHSIYPSVGYFGPITRGFVNSHP